MKKMLYTLLCLFLMINVYGQTSEPDGHRLTVILEDAPFNSLYLHDYTEERNVLFTGQKTGKYTWTFDVPLSIVDDSEFMQLLVYPFDPRDTSSSSVRFMRKDGEEKSWVSNVGIDSKKEHIHARYIDRNRYENEKIKSELGNPETIVTGTLKVENFELMDIDENSDIAVRSKEPYFSWFMPGIGKEDKSYEEYLASYTKLAKEFPDSKYLISYLSRNLNNYKSPEDARLVFDNLSEKHKQSVWGAKIKRFLTHKFQNMELFNLAENAHQKVIQDSSKFNLIIFSASYCKPCIEEIPLLKEIKKELGDRIIFTYVSLDRKDDTVLFERLLVNHEIPWRTLYAYDLMDEVHDMYYINAIPHNLFVYPDGHMDIRDVRKEAHLQEIYKRVKEEAE